MIPSFGSNSAIANDAAMLMTAVRAVKDMVSVKVCVEVELDISVAGVAI
jgi:hypothetical protein